MSEQRSVDTIVVGSGPNGLAAAITLQRAGRSVRVYEACSTVGGGARSAQLTLPGFIHDVCSAIHPLAIASPFFRSVPLSEYGLSWIQPPAALAHPLDDGSAILLQRSTEATAETLGPDKRNYQRLMDPLVSHWEELLGDILGPLPFPPKHPIVLTGFGLKAIQSADHFAASHFQGQRARAFFAGLSAHSILPLDRPVSAAFGLMMAMLGHAVGWPIPKEGSQNISNALAAYLQSLGGEIHTDHPVESVNGLLADRPILFDVTPRQLLKIAGSCFPEGYRKQLQRYRYGPGVFKVDWALNGPIPWKAQECQQAGTVHVGGQLEEISAAEKAVWKGENPERPFVILAQQSLFDASRAPQGTQTAWGYCHVPNGSTADMTERIEAQIERFAPGFRDCIIARSVKSPAEMELYNSNYIGGDINGGVQDLWQLFTRPAPRWVPYSTPDKRIFICSSSTPPGGGVHGMCGYYAAKAALK